MTSHNIKLDSLWKWDKETKKEYKEHFMKFSGAMKGGDESDSDAKMRKAAAGVYIH